MMVILTLAVYTVKLAGVVYVLHVFQKKSKHGIATLKQDLELIEKRLKLAPQPIARIMTDSKTDKIPMTEVTVGSGNVFADLGLQNPEERLVKAQLARQIYICITDRNLTQAEAATILGIDQPKVSNLINGKLAAFSIDRLFRFLNALDCNVEIMVKTKPPEQPTAQVFVLN